MNWIEIELLVGYVDEETFSMLLVGLYAQVLVQKRVFVELVTLRVIVLALLVDVTFGSWCTVY